MYGEVKVFPPLIGGWDRMPRYELAVLWQEDVANLAALAAMQGWDFSIDFLKKEMRKPRKTILVTSVSRKIIYASHYFETMTGYQREEIFGLKPDFLQGPATDKLAVQKISHALNIPEKVTSVLVNYKKDGTPYLCDIEIIPVFNNNHQLVNFLAVEQEEATF